jgi:hypothetical protein
VVDPFRRQRDAQRLGDVLLADHLGKGRRTILAIKGERHAARLPVAPDTPETRTTLADSARVVRYV